MKQQPLIAVISATPAAIDPARSGILAAIPGAQVWNILDDRLLSGAEAVGGVDDRLRARMRRLIDHAVREGADAVVLSCSQYGAVATDVDSRSDIPVLPADAAAFQDIVARDPRRILVLASLQSAAEDTVARLAAAAAQMQSCPDIRRAVPDGTAHAARNPDPAVLVDVLERAVREEAEVPDVVLLAQYSLYPAAAQLSQRMAMPVVSGAATVGEQLARRLRMTAS